ncbi:MAG TPA: hypothetical protein VFS39_16005 [Nitrospira sp.]|nr:hypothetical protein [Nitrospira sp.]
MLRRWVPVVAVAWLPVSCGVVGPPIPPENVGVALTIEQQKQREREAQQREADAGEEKVGPDASMQGQDVNLPPLRPVGTR